jgi:hypothetical protein
MHLTSFAFVICVLVLLGVASTETLPGTDTPKCKLIHLPAKTAVIQETHLTFVKLQTFALIFFMGDY